MTSPRPSQGIRAPESDRGGPAAAAEETLKLLGKAVRAHQLYLQNNPTYHRALELLRRSFAHLWEQLPELTLQVGEQALVWEGRALYNEAERGADALPWLLYKDGIRELRLLPGIEGEEIERLLDVVRLLGRAAGGEDDAITLLWDRDFAFLRYRFIEAASEESGEFRLAPTPGRLSDEEPAAPAAVAGTVGIAPAGAATAAVPRPAGVVDLQDFDAAPFFLAERELAYLREGLVAEYAHDLHGDVVAMLLDVFEAQPTRRTRDEVCEALDEMLLLALSTGNYRGVGALLREVAATLARATALAPEHRARLEALGAQLGTVEGLTRLTGALDVAETLPDERELETLFGQLSADALGPLLGRLGEVQTPRLRAALRAAADRLALAHTAQLAALVSSADEAIAQEAVQRAGALRTAAAVPALAGVLRGGSGDLRGAAARALAEIGSVGALQELAGVLDDRDREVRLAAVRAVAQQRYRGALAPLDAIVRERRVRDADLTEQMAVFEAYGALCGDDGVAYLDGLLNGRTMLGRRQDPPIRACAAVALGRADTPKARAALARAADEKDVVVRAAVQRAVRGGA